MSQMLDNLTGFVSFFLKKELCLVLPNCLKNKLYKIPAADSRNTFLQNTLVTGKCEITH